MNVGKNSPFSHFGRMTTAKKKSDYMTVSPRAKMSPPKKRRKGGFSSNLVGFSLLLLVEGRHNFYSAHMFSHIMRGKTCVEDSNFPLASAATTTTLIFLFPLSVTSLLSAGSITIMRKKEHTGRREKKICCVIFPVYSFALFPVIVAIPAGGLLPPSLPPSSLFALRKVREFSVCGPWGSNIFFPLPRGQHTAFSQKP